MRTDKDGQTAEAQGTKRRDGKTLLSLAEAAASLGIRQDSLAVILPDIKLDRNTGEKGMLTRNDVDRLRRLIQYAKEVTSEGTNRDVAL